MTTKVHEGRQQPFSRIQELLRVAEEETKDKALAQRFLQPGEREVQFGFMQGILLASSIVEQVEKLSLGIVDQKGASK